MRISFSLSFAAFAGYGHALSYSHARPRDKNRIGSPSSQLSMKLRLSPSVEHNISYYKRSLNGFTSQPSSYPSASQYPSNTPSFASSTAQYHSNSPSTVQSSSLSLTPTTISYPNERASISPSENPTFSYYPSESPPTNPTEFGSRLPSTSPSISLTNSPSVAPSWQPSTIPTFAPSKSQYPSDYPSIAPSWQPSALPSFAPSSSQYPSDYPNIAPSWQPSALPSFAPSSSQYPSDYPNIAPSWQPSALPSFAPSSSQYPSDFSSSSPNTSLNPSLSSEDFNMFPIPSYGPSSSVTISSSIPTIMEKTTELPSSSAEPTIRDFNVSPIVGPSSKAPSQTPTFEPFFSGFPSLTPTSIVGMSTPSVSPLSKTLNPTNDPFSIPSFKPTTDVLPTNALIQNPLKKKSDLTIPFIGTSIAIGGIVLIAVIIHACKSRFHNGGGLVPIDGPHLSLDQQGGFSSNGDDSSLLILSDELSGRSFDTVDLHAGDFKERFDGFEFVTA